MTHSPKIWTIPAGLPFAERLARELLRRHEPSTDLADTTLLVPTYRAAQTLRQAFPDACSPKPVLMPRILPLGDAGEDEIDPGETGGGPGADGLPPAISPVRRKLLLSRLVAAMHPERAGKSLAEAARLAGDLILLLDTLQYEEVPLESLDGLVEGDLADHWQETLRFLGILREGWPAILEERGVMEPVERRCRILRRLAERWEESPPPGPVLVVGSTGSIPASRALIRTVHSLEQGEVVLPGLDRDIDEDSWAEIENCETHPQFGIRQLLEELGARREDVGDWPGTEQGASARARARLLSEAMRPAETSDRWPRTAGALESGAATEGLALVEARDTVEEAGAIALLMRETLETEGRTCALVANDQELTRRVRINLRRWDIDIEEPAGEPLAEKPGATLFRLAARAGASGGRPVDLLSLLKHRLAACGTTRSACRRHARSVERRLVRGLRPWDGIDALRRRVRDRGKVPPALSGWLDEVDRRLRPLRDLLQGRAEAREVLAAHRELAEWIAGDGSAKHPLYEGDAGRRFLSFLDELGRAAEELGEIDGADYPGIFDAALEGERLFRRLSHPRLSIWTPIEARMQSADRVIAGGLVEGMWPRNHPADPWLSRNMRKELRLPTVERRTGLAAHDFVSAATAGEAFLTHAVKARGTPTVPARWITRLRTVLKAAGTGTAESEAPSWWRTLFQAPAYAPIPRPRFAPPLEARPRELSVTRLRTLFREPYATYGAYVLRLRPLDPLAAAPGPGDFGLAAHSAVERFTAAHGGPGLPADALDQLLTLGAEEFRAFQADPATHAFWLHRFRRIARWFLEREEEARKGLRKVLAESKGTLEIPFPGGRAFTVTARADRIEEREDGTLAIIDYKSGVLSRTKEVEAADDPQLPLSALIASHGGFEGVPASAVSDLAYWRLTGRGDGGETRPAGRDLGVDEMMEASEARLRKTVDSYDDESVAYEAVEDPEGYSDYLDLARVREWTIAGVKDEDE